MTIRFVTAIVIKFAINCFAQAARNFYWVQRHAPGYHENGLIHP